MIESYTCRRKSHRWTTNAFFYLLDVGYNSYALFKIKDPLEVKKLGNTRSRRIMLTILAESLIYPQIEIRINEAKKSNFSCLKLDILNSFQLAGFEINKENQTDKGPRKRCDFCIFNKNMKKEKNICDICSKAFCNLHGRLNVEKKCFKCSETNFI